MTHGKIVNKSNGVEIPGEFFGNWSPRDWVDFRIDGTDFTNAFKTADWDFVEDKKPLPNVLGTVVSISNWDYPNYYFRTREGWVNCSSGNTYSDERLDDWEWEVVFESNGDKV